MQEIIKFTIGNTEAFFPLVLLIKASGAFGAKKHGASKLIGKTIKETAKEQVKDKVKESLQKKDDSKET